jgi:hypothetical protein
LASAKPVSFGAKVVLPGFEGVTSVNIGDINRDGLADIAVFEGGKHNKGTQYFAWFEAPDWERHDFHSSKPGTCIGDTEMADMKGDGWLDIVAPGWYSKVQSVWIIENAFASPEKRAAGR